MNEKRLAKITVILTAIVIIGKIFGFLREVLLAQYFGTEAVVDAYIMSYTIPAILFGTLPALAMGFTPCYFKIQDKKRDDFTSNVIITSCFIALICIAVTYIWAEEIVAIIARGFQGHLYKLTIQFLKVTIWTILFNTPIQILMAYLNCRKLYIFSNVTNLVLSTIQSVFVIIAAYVDETILPFGLLVSYVMQFVLLLSFSALKGYRFRFVGFVDENIKTLFRFAIPMFVSNLLVDINGFVDKYLGSFLKEGSIAALNYAFTIRAFFYYVFTSAITTLFYPNITEMIAKKNIKQAGMVIQKTLNIIMIIFIPLTVTCIFLSQDIIYIILQRGKFDARSLQMTAIPFVCYMLSLVIISMRDLIIKVMYAFEDSKSNLKYGMISVGLNIIFSSILVRDLGHVGLALGTSLSAIVTFPIYLLKLKRFVPAFSIKQSWLKVLKIITSCIPMAGIYIVLNIGIHQNIVIEVMKVFVLSGVTVLITFVCMYLIKIEEITIIVKKLFCKKM